MFVGLNYKQLFKTTTPHIPSCPNLVEITVCWLIMNPVDGGAWWAAVHGVARSQTRLGGFTFTFRDWRRKWQPTPVFLPGESQGWGSLVGCRLWGRTESDTTERLPFHFSLSCIGEGNGNPLQCPCLENPRDRGAWWAAIYGVAESDTTEAT